MEIEQDFREHEVNLGNDQERTDLIATFHVIGTVVSETTSGVEVPNVRPVLSLNQ